MSPCAERAHCVGSRPTAPLERSSFIGETARLVGGVFKSQAAEAGGEGCFLSLDLQVLTHPVYLIFCWLGNFDHGLIQINLMYLSTLCPKEVQKGLEFNRSRT